MVSVELIRVSVSYCLLRPLWTTVNVNVVFVGDGDRLVVSDVAVKCFEFRLVVVYAPNIAVERVFPFRRFSAFLDNSKRLLLMGDWNAILDPKINKVGQRASTLIDFIARHNLVDRFRVDNPGREMWTWLERRSG